jgi:hypothetical protein
MPAPRIRVHHAHGVNPLGRCCSTLRKFHTALPPHVHRPALPLLLAALVGKSAIPETGLLQAVVTAVIGGILS